MVILKVFTDVYWKTSAILSLIEWFNYNIDGNKLWQDQTGDYLCCPFLLCNHKGLWFYVILYTELSLYIGKQTSGAGLLPNPWRGSVAMLPGRSSRRRKLIAINMNLDFVWTPLLLTMLCRHFSLPFTWANSQIGQLTNRVGLCSLTIPSCRLMKFQHFKPCFHDSFEIPTIYPIPPPTRKPCEDQCQRL